MARVQVNIRFFYEDAIYADTIGYLPRQEAFKIPQLKVEENMRRNYEIKRNAARALKPNKDEEIEDEMVDQIEEDNIPEMDHEEIDNIDQQIDEDEPDPQMEIQPSDNLQYDEEEEEEDEIDVDLSELSHSISPMMNYTKYKTKRQKGQLDNFIQLPNKRPRKDAKKFDQATELIRKEQKERKRRQYIKKLTEDQEKATFNKILNETGRKFRQREEKELKEEQDRDKKLFHTLGDIPKIICKNSSKGGNVVILHKRELFDPSLLCEPDVKMGQACRICKQAVGKYKDRRGVRFCSTACYKNLQHQETKMQK